MDTQDLKVNIAEIYLLKYKYMLEYQLGNRYINKFEEYRNKKKIILTLIPTHDNLGDHAIAYASRKFLENEFSDHEIIEINIREIYTYAKSLRSVMNPDDMVFIIGGGNMGDLYRNEEWTRRFIIRTFREYKVIQLPATVHFTNTSKGEKELRVAKRIYNSHPNLLILARDSTSYEFMKMHFGDQNVIKNPDMVLYLDESIESNQRKGILLCLRNDKESCLDDNQRKEIKQSINEHHGHFEEFTTTVGYRVNNHTREAELKGLWNKLSKSKVVITDRLHGMIFCAITGTPCVVIRSFDHKVMEGFQWLQELNYIRLVEKPTAETINKEIDELLSVKKINKINYHEKYFKKLRKQIMESNSDRDVLRAK
ncbi:MULTISPECIES: polysaccharide pyruvyl transferase family protein [Bacillus cereus group]|uniref:polysaccharide pyruvyl transferase family protein n=1 Tax=Bacillus cereus group TaxID=86661 RepID=UPI0001A09B8D|nr:MULTISPECIES: polysaccharide pyruvyl transferase family protein [Bacillus cereus group]EEL48452.1 hypothetical protein bcere0022_43150 [Bacillus cereus Rock3-44]PFO80440.1 pyruvyl transferase [Bacillus cereus]